jgi:hypothetical protein
MANYTAYHVSSSGLDIYAKPLPLTLSPWSTGVVVLNEVGSTGTYSGTLVSQTQYLVFVRGGLNPADTDVIDGSFGANIWDNILTGATHNIAGSAGRRLRQIADTVVLDDGANGGASNSGPDGTGTIILKVGTTTACVGQSVRSNGQVRFIESYDPATREAILDQPWCVIPDTGEDYTIYSQRSPLVGKLATALAGTFGWALQNLQSLLENVSGWRFTEKALEEAPVTICGGSSGGGAFSLDMSSSVRLTLVRNDDYSALDGRQIDIPIELPDGYDYSTATICFSMHRIRSGVRIPGQSHVCLGTASIEEIEYEPYLRLEFDADDLDLPAGTYYWTAHATKSDRRITLRTGTLILLEDIE